MTSLHPPSFHRNDFSTCNIIANTGIQFFNRRIASWESSTPNEMDRAEMLQYGHQSKAGLDLIERVPLRQGMNVLDLGCGRGLLQVKLGDSEKCDVEKFSYPGFLIMGLAD